MVKGIVIISNCYNIDISFFKFTDRASETGVETAKPDSGKRETWKSRYNDRSIVEELTKSKNSTRPLLKTVSDHESRANKSVLTGHR